MILEREKIEEIAIEGTMGTSPPTAQPLNTLGMLLRLNGVLSVEYRGESVTAGCTLILAIIHAESSRTGNLVPLRVIVSRFGNKAKYGIYFQILERNGLIERVKIGHYRATTDGELLIRNIVTDLNRILLSRPTKRMREKLLAEANGHRPQPWTKNVKGRYNAVRPKPPIETFNQLVEEVLSKPGLNQKAKYALLRALGMSMPEAKEALKKLAPLKHTERIKPILKGILSELVNKS